jgi:hypothetical protein
MLVKRRRMQESSGCYPNPRRVVIQFAQDLSLRFEMTDYLACHFERIARNLSSLQRDPFKLHHHPASVNTAIHDRNFMKGSALNL